MEGGTTFYFVTDGIHAALERAQEAAQGKDVRLGGGVATIRQYLTAGLIDEIHLVISPVLLGRGEHLLQILLVTRRADVSIEGDLRRAVQDRSQASDQDVADVVSVEASDDGIGLQGAH